MYNTDGLTRVERGERKRKAQHRLLKIELMTHYGNGKCACVRCGFDDLRALSIDHIGGNGNYLRTVGKEPRGGYFYKWLKEKSFPSGYQALCMNCQFIKRFEKDENNATAQQKAMRNGWY